jgi:predicted PurR-regulated permease PerM
VQRAIGALPQSRRSWAEALAHDLSSSLGSYLAGLGTIVIARVVATGAFLAIARIPFVFPLALLAGVSVLIPYVGSVLRLLVIGAAAWATRGSGGALAALAFVAAYDVVENYAISPIVFRKTLGIGALEQLIVVLFLGYHLGVAGAVLAIPLAATAHIVTRSLRRPATDATTPARAEGTRLETGPEGHLPPREAPADGRAGD